MFGEHHHLATEFPEHKDRIHELKIGNNAHFNKLYGEYNNIDNNIYRIEEGIENTVNWLKKELNEK